MNIISFKQLIKAEMNLKGESEGGQVKSVETGSSFEKGSNKEETGREAEPGEKVQEEAKKEGVEMRRKGANEGKRGKTGNREPEMRKEENSEEVGKKEEAKWKEEEMELAEMENEGKSREGKFEEKEQENKEKELGKKPEKEGEIKNEKIEEVEKKSNKSENDKKVKTGENRENENKPNKVDQESANNNFQIIDLIGTSPKISSEKKTTTINLTNNNKTSHFISNKRRNIFGHKPKIRKMQRKRNFMLRKNLFSSQNKNVEGRFNRPKIRRKQNLNSKMNSNLKSNSKMLVYSAFSNKGRGNTLSSFDNSAKKITSHAESHSYHISENTSQKSVPSISLVGKEFAQGNLKNGELMSDIESHESFSVRGKGFRKIRGMPSPEKVSAEEPRTPKPVLRFNRPRVAANLGVSPQIIETVNAEPTNIPELVIPENEEEFRLPESILQPFKSSYNVDDHKNTVSIAKRLKKKGSNPFRFREVRGLFGGFSHKDNRRFPQAKRFLLKSLRLLQRKQNRQFMSCGARSVCIDLMGDTQSFSEVKGFMRRPKTSNLIPGTVYDLLGDGRAKEVMSCLDDGGRRWNRGRLGNAQSKFMISLEGASVLGSVKKSDRTKDDFALGKREHLSLIEEVKHEDELERAKMAKVELGSFKVEERQNMSDPKIKTPAMQMNFYSDSKNDLKRAKLQAKNLQNSVMNIDMANINSPVRKLPKGFSSNLDKKVFEGGGSFYQKRSSQNSKNLDMSI